MKLRPARPWAGRGASERVKRRRITAASAGLSYPSSRGAGRLVDAREGRLRVLVVELEVVVEEVLHPQLVAVREAGGRPVVVRLDDVRGPLQEHLVGADVPVLITHDPLVPLLEIDPDVPLLSGPMNWFRLVE